jgi:hypothetical protein
MRELNIGNGDVQMICHLSKFKNNLSRILSISLKLTNNKT